MLNHIITKKRNKSKLVLARSTFKAIIELSLYIIFIAGWYWILIEDFSSFEAIKEGFFIQFEEKPLIILFYLAPLMIAKRIWLNLTTIFFGNKYEFNANRNAFFHNGEKICSFGSMSHVEISYELDSDHNLSYTLEIIYDEDKRFFIATSEDKPYIEFIAWDIGNISGAKIEHNK